MGGDEFALLTIGAMSPEEARRKVEFICKTVAAPYHVAGSLLTIGTSCGFASTRKKARIQTRSPVWLTSGCISTSKRTMPCRIMDYRGKK